MKELIQKLEDGDFTVGYAGCTIKLNGSGQEIWTGNGLIFLGFHPISSEGFSFIEKIKINRAIKKGLLKQSVRN